MPRKPPESERTKEEVERLAGELARKVMSMPHQKHEWPGKRKGAKPKASARK